MDAYKEIAEINSLSAEKEFRTSIEDAYGDLPAETDNLINIAVVKILASKLKISKITVKRGEVRLTFREFNAFGNKKLQYAMDEFGDSVVVSMAGEPSIEFLNQGDSNDEMLRLVKEFLKKAV
jgi:transcription-repair coupling factor (superfamily II helicase)